MKTKTLWKIHSWLGLLAGIPLLVISISGSILVFKDEIDGLLRPEQVRAQPTSEGRLPHDELHQKANAALEHHEIVGRALYPEPHRADFLYVMAHGDDEFLSLHQNPYTGELLHSPLGLEDHTMGWLLSLHYRLLGGHVGEAITGVLAVMLCALGVTGILIYRKFWAQFFTLRWKSSARLLTGQFHKRIGILSSPVFLILGFTGAWWNISHIIEELDHEEAEEGSYEIHGGYLADAVSLDKVLEDSRQRISGYSPNYISFPIHPGESLRLFGSYENQNPLRSPYHSVVTYDANTGEHLTTTRIEDSSISTQILDSFTPLHFGTFGGLPVKVLWCIVGSAPGFLAISGYFITWKRRRPAKLN